MVCSSLFSIMAERVPTTHSGSVGPLRRLYNRQCVGGRDTPGHDGWSHDGWSHDGWSHDEWRHDGWRHDGWRHDGWRHDGWRHDAWRHGGESRDGQSHEGWGRDGWGRDGLSHDGERAMTEGRPRVRDHLVRTKGRRSGHREHKGQLRRVRLQPDVAVSLSISRSARM